MKIHIINAINAIALILIGLWGYLGSNSPSVTALIPVFAGIILLLLSYWLKSGNKTIAHIVVVVTLLLLFAFFKPLIGAFHRNDTAAVLRVLLMMLTCIIALVVYIKSFINARNSRKTENVR
jgi:uncharacterized membrane protein (UPF0136 family)